MLEEENNKEELYEKTCKEYAFYPHNNDGLLDSGFYLILTICISSQDFTH